MYQEAIAKHSLQAHASILISFLLHFKALVILLLYIYIVSHHCAFMRSSLYLVIFDRLLLNFQTPK